MRKFEKINDSCCSFGNNCHCLKRIIISAAPATYTIAGAVFVRLSKDLKNDCAKWLSQFLISRGY